MRSRIRSSSSFHDGSSKVSLVTRSDLGEWDARRFRMNVILDGSGTIPSDGELALGSATVLVRKPVTRCVMVTRPQPGIERDLEVYRQIRPDCPPTGRPADVSLTTTISNANPIWLDGRGCRR